MKATKVKLSGLLENHRDLQRILTELGMTKQRMTLPISNSKRNRRNSISFFYEKNQSDFYILYVIDK